MAEYLARVTWENILKYRKEKIKKDDTYEGSRKLLLTDQYASNQLLMDKLKFGDGLWLFTAPTYGEGSHPRTLPPSVLGRISITHQWSRKDPKIRPAFGAPINTKSGSITKILDVSGNYLYWRGGIPGDVLPINNAFSLFKSLTFKGRIKRVDPACPRCNPSKVPKNGPFGHLMQHFESIRSLTDESVTQLNKLHEHVVSRRTLFLSHKHLESSSLISDVAKHLQNYALCWWDVQELPQSRHYEDLILQNVLNDGIRQAGWFVAFLTPGYGKTKWTDDELKKALELCTRPDIIRKPKILPILLGGSMPDGIKVQQPISVGSDSKAIATSIRDRLESLA